MDHIERLTALDVLAAPSGCETQPAKTDPVPPSPERELCQITARLEYLLALIACEAQVNPALCCAEAYETYCKAWDACPD